MDTLNILENCGNFSYKKYIMKKEAVQAGFYKTGGQKIPKLQILMVEDLLNKTAEAKLAFGHNESYVDSKEFEVDERQMDLF